MSLALLFLYLMLNMFRMLIHPSSAACDLCAELFRGLYWSGSMCVGVTLQHKASIYYSASSLYMFRVSTTPIIRSTQNSNYSLRYWSYILWSRWREVAVQKIWPVPEAVVTVLCNPDDGCGRHPKHVEWTRRIINRLLCVASHWTVINIDQRCTELWT